MTTVFVAQDYIQK